mmetsp:Transcript_28137/g.58642  ORF Transcript_28137/g.58642 Transcript_28137/m.58642 type:complete len:81 (+) Transcript_28137:126-368(+)
MFETFQIMGARSKEEGKNKVDDMKDAIYSFFKKNMGTDGKFLKSDPNMKDARAVGDDVAKEKIRMDLVRRNDSSKQWLKV